MIKRAIFILLLVISVISYLILNKDVVNLQKNMKNFSDLLDREHVQIKVGEKIINVEVVNTPKSTAQGLSGRDEIGTQGMLFIFPKTETRYFWMKDMNFDIDIVWITDSKVIDISRNVPTPQPNTPDFKLETYSAKDSVNMVLELNSGVAQEYNINPGDVVQLVQKK
jgi:uncharacterized membrane protein (UPF0127 family)